MITYEYMVVPAPRKGLKEKGVKGAEARFARALEQVMNEFGAAGWEYQRSDTLPSDERQGLSGTTTTYRTMLVFRRAIEVIEDDEAEDELRPERLEPPVQALPPEPAVQPAHEPETDGEEPPTRDVAAQ